MGMVQCPRCGRQTIENREVCHFCNAPLPKGILGKFFSKLLKPTQESAGTDSPFVQEALARGEFRMKAEGIFSIAGRGTVVTGKIEMGSARVGDTVVFTSRMGEKKMCRISSIERFRKLLEKASAGEQVGLLLAGVEKGEVAVGTLLVKSRL